MKDCKSLGYYFCVLSEFTILRFGWEKRNMRIDFSDDIPLKKFVCCGLTGLISILIFDAFLSIIGLFGAMLCGFRRFPSNWTLIGNAQCEQADFFVFWRTVAGAIFWV